jgi:hypothetical protein
MFDRGLFISANGFPEMVAFNNVEEALSQEGIDLDVKNPFFQILVLEELIRLDRKSKLEWVAQNRKRVCERRLDGEMPSIEFLIEDFFTGRFFSVPDKFIKEQSKEEILNTERIDHFTFKRVPVTRIE